MKKLLPISICIITLFTFLSCSYEIESAKYTTQTKLKMIEFIDYVLEEFAFGHDDIMIDVVKDYMRLSDELKIERLDSVINAVNHRIDAFNVRHEAVKEYVKMIKFQIDNDKIRAIANKNGWTFEIYSEQIAEPCFELMSYYEIGLNRFGYQAFTKKQIDEMSSDFDTTYPKLVKMFNHYLDDYISK